MNKPKWDDAPEWASYLAQDKYGGWAWYENEPIPFDGYCGDIVDGADKWSRTNDDMKNWAENPDWINTMEPRP